MSGNATTNDLWSALSQASNQDVHKFMVSQTLLASPPGVFLTLPQKDPWIRKIGFPVLTVAEEPGQISIRQNRFLSTGDAKPEEDVTTWWIPLGIKSGPRLADVDSRALVSKSDTIAGVGQDSFYKINKDLSGFYRTNYPADRLAKLGQSLDLLSTEDKIGLIGDAAALAVSGEGTSAALLALLEGFKGEENYLLVPSTFIRAFELLLTVFIPGFGHRFRRLSQICALSFRRMTQ
jgi:aminopeptidase N